MTMLEREDYRNGGEGFILWAEENICVQITPIGSDQKVWVPVGDLPTTKNPETNRSYRDMWELQKEIFVAALEMQNGVFKHNLIVFNWPRGDGKSFGVCLIVIWRISCWLDQKIVLGANSKDQTKFVHYEEIKNLCYNSPNVLQEIGNNNILEKELRMTDNKKNVRSYIRPISAFSGLVPNINAFTFSEMFLMKNESYFTQLYGSIRNIPNAFGLIDTTVSAKQHPLYRMYKAYVTGENSLIYYSYRCSEKAKPADYFHPNMTKDQLASYRSAMLDAEFNRYFKNTWSSGAEKVFTEEIIEATNYFGVDKLVNTHNTLIALLEHKNKVFKTGEMMKAKAGLENEIDVQKSIDNIQSRLWPVSDVYKLASLQSDPKMAEVTDLEALSEIYDTEWAIIGGFDRADPLKDSSKSPAKTIAVILAKGLIGSRSNPMLGHIDNPKYLYIMLALKNIPRHSLPEIREVFIEAHTKFDGMDMIGSERYGAWDLAEWCDENDIGLELWQSSYTIQRAMFTELFISYRDGFFKTPPIHVPGAKDSDILKEEAAKFDHDDEKRWFGSPEKKEKYGVQDDAMFAVGGTIYAGRKLTVVDFRARKGQIDFGVFYRNPALLGNYAE